MMKTFEPFDDFRSQFRPQTQFLMGLHCVSVLSGFSFFAFVLVFFCVFLSFVGVF